MFLEANGTEQKFGIIIYESIVNYCLENAIKIHSFIQNSRTKVQNISSSESMSKIFQFLSLLS